MQSIIVPIAFLFLALLVAWFVIGSKGGWWLKLLAMLTSIAISSLLYLSLGSYFGYPRVATADSIPAKAKFCWGQINEPSQDNKGAIYMWLKIDNITSNNPFDYIGEKGEPIIFKFPYTRKLHETVAKLLALIIDQKGGDEDIMLVGVDPPKPGSRQGGYSDAIGTSGGTFEVYDLPAPKLPPKVSN